MKYLFLACAVCACTSTTLPNPETGVTGHYRVYFDAGNGIVGATWKATVEKEAYLYTAYSDPGEDSVFGGYPWSKPFFGKDTTIAQTTGSRAYWREDFEWIDGGYTFEHWTGKTGDDEEYMTYYKFRFMRLD